MSSSSSVVVPRPTPAASFNWLRARTDILSGLTVALALVPEAVAFAFVCGVPPLSGLYAAFVVCLVTSAFGGRPGMISGATGAVAVVVAALVQTHGIEYLFATVVLAGVLQVLAGLARLGKFVRLVPEAVMFGFVNGLALVIGLAQLDAFRAPVQLASGEMGRDWLQGSSLLLMVGLTALTMGVVWLVSRWTKAFPAPLAGILTVSALVLGFGLSTRSVGDMASIAGSLPSFHLPLVPLNWETLSIIFPYAVTVAAVGLVESLMTLTLIDELTETRGQSNRECVALGSANVLTGLVGGMGGCAMIGQSVINVKSGGRGRLSGVSAAGFLLLFILFGAPLIERIPLAALTGVMFMVVIGTFEWSSFRVMRRVPRSDAFVIVLVSAVTVIADLAIAVFVGVIVSALAFAWQKSSRISAAVEVRPSGTKVYRIEGSLFFASIATFRELFQLADDPERVVVDMSGAQIYGHAGLDALHRLSERYAKAGKRLYVANLSSDCRALFELAGDLVRIDLQEEPSHPVAAAPIG